MPCIARLKGRPDIFLLAEEELLDSETNTAFNGAGTAGQFRSKQFDPGSVREIDREAQEVTAAQWQAYDRHWAAVESDEIRQRLEAHAKQHPFRQGAERFGGVFLPKGPYEWTKLVSRLEAWLKNAKDEDVIGDIGTYAGKDWVTTTVPTVPELITGPMAVGIHADTRALGVASFLAFVERCGGPAHVCARRTAGPPILTSEDGNEEFPRSPGPAYFYMS